MGITKGSDTWPPKGFVYLFGGDFPETQSFCSTILKEYEGKEAPMLFVTMYSWDKEKRDEVIKRRLEKGVMTPKGVKRLGEWTSIGRRVGFSVIETDDPKLIVQANMAWNDIIDYDIFPVLDTEKDLLGLLKG